MRALGRRLARLLRAGDLVILGGPLGSGKTTLVQGMAEGLQVRGPVTSPTFVIARVHPSLVHADAYRLASPAEVDDLDLDAHLERSVTVVEWGGGLAEDLAADRLEIRISFAGGGQSPAAGGGLAAGGGPAQSAGLAGPGDEPRTVRIAGVGRRWQAVPDSAFLAGPAAAEAL
jgi:tRNA threonylcarbamoyladenosine biosynthesis protein TsaE